MGLKKMLNNFWLYLRKEADDLNEEHDEAARKIGLNVTATTTYDPTKFGLGTLGQHNLEVKFRRKFRWIIEVLDDNGENVIPPHFTKVASRPNLRVEET